MEQNFNISKEANVTQTVLCAAFCGTGKTFLCNNFINKCIEFEDWKYYEGNFPYNYIADIYTQLGKVEYLFISTNPKALKKLNQRGLNIKLVYPNIELKEEYLNRFINRNNTPEFIKMLNKYWDEWINELQNLNYCEHIVLKSGQYLKDVLL